MTALRTTAAGSPNSPNSRTSGVNSGFTGMDRGCSFRVGLQGLGAVRRYLGALMSYFRAQGPLDMMESGRAVPRREQSLGQFH